MKWQLLSLVTAAVAVLGCDALTDEPTAGVHSASGMADPRMTHKIGLNMTGNKQVKLAIHRDSSGNPRCVVVDGFGNSVQSVPLQLGGTGMWKLNADVADNEAQGTYDRYRPAEHNQNLDLVLHWTKERGNLRESNLTNPKDRLEYFIVTWNNNDYKYRYEYRSDIDGKSNLVLGSQNTQANLSSVDNVRCGS